MKTDYTIEQITPEDIILPDVMKYLHDVGPEISKLFDNKLNWQNCDVINLALRGIFLVCRRNGEIRGHMICSLSQCPLDTKVKILRQISFYVKPNSGRTAYHLFHKFIDIGKERANHIITCLTTHTNIKSETLEKLGFKELETLYRLET